MLRMVRPDKQNYNNNAPDDNEDNHQSPHLTINPLMPSGGRVGEEKSVLNLGLDIFGFRIFYDMRLLSPAQASAGEM